MPLRPNPEVSTLALDLAMVGALGFDESVETPFITGRNPLINVASTPETIWGGGTPYVFLDSFETMSMSSDSELNNNKILIDYLDSDYRRQQKQFTLQGQTPVNLTGAQILRINWVKNMSPSMLPGIVYVYGFTSVTGGVPDDLTKLRAKILPKDGISLSAVYTVPAEKRLILYNFWANAVKSSGSGILAVELKLEVRAKDGAWTTFLPISMTANSINKPFLNHPHFKEEVDIRITIENTSTNNVEINAGLDAILVSDAVALPNTQFFPPAGILPPA